jgi:hypothetical protein
VTSRCSANANAQSSGARILQVHLRGRDEVSDSLSCQGVRWRVKGWDDTFDRSSSEFEGNKCGQISRTSPGAEKTWRGGCQKTIGGWRRTTANQDNTIALGLRFGI